VLNVLLTGTIFAKYESESSDEGLYADAGKVLETRGVRVLCELPKDVRTSELIIYGDSAKLVENVAKGLGESSGGMAVVDISADGALVYRNAAPTEALDVRAADADLDAAVRALLLQKGVDLSAYGTDEIARGMSGTFAGSDGVAIRYLLHYAGKPVFDGRVTVLLDGGGGVSELTASVKSVLQVSGAAPMDVIPIYQVLLKNYPDAGTAIRSIDIGFMGMGDNDADGETQAQDSGGYAETESGAVWRVRTEDGAERFFEAAYGDEIFPGFE